MLVKKKVMICFGNNSNVSINLCINLKYQKIFFCWKNINFLVVNVMDLVVNCIIENFLTTIIPPKGFKVTRFKTISGNIHAVIVDIKDEQSEILVALSVLGIK